MAELIALLALLSPLGLLILRAGERLLALGPRLLPVERLLLSAFVAGAVLFWLASIGLPLFTRDVVVGLGVLGVVAMAAVWIRERGRTLADGVRWIGSWPGLIAIAGFVGLLAVEVYGVQGYAFSNSYDGATHSLWVTVLLRNHGIPWTVAPFANVGITYPQGAPVWEALPPLLFGWTVPESPVFLPALFLALSVPAAYVLGARLAGRGPLAPPVSGALFATFFALVAAFPRLFLGGSYDLALAFPLFLVLLGWLPWFVAETERSWKEVAAFAIVLGIGTSLSWMVGLEMLALLGAFYLARVVLAHRALVPAILRFLAVLAVAALFLFRSIIGTAVWFSYPGRVLSPVGSRPYSALPPGSGTTYRYLTGELDPFILFKARLSPIEWMSVLIAISLAVGLALMILAAVVRSAPVRRLLSERFVGSMALASVTTFVMASVLILAGAPASGLPDVSTLTNVDELSVILFLFYGVIALSPLLACAAYLARTLSSRRAAEQFGSRATPASAVRVARRRARPATALAMATLLVVVGAGGVSTAVELPSYIDGHLAGIANVTSGDIEALQWSGANLPSCARVFVAPGSAAEYLPEYAVVPVVFPAFPAVYNLSYANALSSLVAGNYSSAVRADLLALGVIAVFVTGRTTSQFPPLNPAAFGDSPDFVLEFEAGDAQIYEFLPGTMATGCTIP